MKHRFSFIWKNRGRRFPEMDLMPVILIGAVILIMTWAGSRFAYRTFSSNINLHGKKDCFVYIPTGTTFNQAIDSLKAGNYLVSKEKFIWLAKRKQYDRHIVPGRYRLTNGMSNLNLVKMLRSGRQEAVRLTVHNVRTPHELAGKLSKRLEPDSVQFLRIFSDPAILSKYGITPATLFVLFIPNTYDLFWNISGELLLEKMSREHHRFWSETRRQQADSLNLSITEVITIASIVEKESNKDDEKPVIAGVYLNRMKKKMLLQADPTVVFAWKDFTIRRVMKKHTELKSPYNTYLSPGLPPGPICLPSIASIEAVLHAKKSDYLYFCAREDLSGYHNFAVTLDEHNRNARKYQTALNKLKIR
jgi:UPF0755 protein